jgi:hypothetical protein
MQKIEEIDSVDVLDAVRKWLESLDHLPTDVERQKICIQLNISRGQLRGYIARNKAYIQPNSQ